MRWLETLLLDDVLVFGAWVFDVHPQKGSACVGVIWQESSCRQTVRQENVLALSFAYERSRQPRRLRREPMKLANERSRQPRGLKQQKLMKLTMGKKGRILRRPETRVQVQVQV